MYDHIWWSHVKHWMSVTAILVSFCLFSQFALHTDCHYMQIHNHTLAVHFPNHHLLLHPHKHTQRHTLHSWPSSMRHLRKSSFLASGLIWFRIPPSRLEVASEATIKGRTTVGGICRRTPPTAPGRPFCSWPRDATSHRV